LQGACQGARHISCSSSHSAIFGRALCSSSLSENPPLEKFRGFPLEPSWLKYTVLIGLPVLIVGRAGKAIQASLKKNRGYASEVTLSGGRAITLDVGLGALLAAGFASIQTARRARTERKAVRVGRAPAPL